MHSKRLEKIKQSLRISQRQREILIGVLLGDGHLETQNNGRTWRLKIEHAWRQKAYVDWLFAAFKPWVKTEPQTRERVVRWRQEKQPSISCIGLIRSASVHYDFTRRNSIKTGKRKYRIKSRGGLRRLRWLFGTWMTDPSNHMSTRP